MNTFAVDLVKLIKLLETKLPKDFYIYNVTNTPHSYIIRINDKNTLRIIREDEQPSYKR